MKIALILLASCLAVQAQTAKVIELSPEDAAKAKSLYTQQAEIQKQIGAMQNQIAERYLQPKKPKDGGYCIINGTTYSCIDDAWRYGFQYSDDFKFIVPKPTATSPSNTLCVGWQCGLNYYTNPVLGGTTGETLQNKISW